MREVVEPQAEGNVYTGMLIVDDRRTGPCPRLPHGDYRPEQVCLLLAHLVRSRFSSDNLELVANLRVHTGTTTRSG